MEVNRYGFDRWSQGLWTVNGGGGIVKKMGKCHYAGRFPDTPNKKYVEDEERLVDEVEVNMTAFKFQVDGEGEAGQVDPILPLVTLTEDDLEVLELLLSLRHNNFYVGKEFANNNLANERIRAYSVETRRNMKFKRNGKRRIRVICKGVVPTMTNKNVFVDKVEGTKEDISRKGKAVNEDAEKDKICCPWVLYFTEGDKAKWVVKTYKDEHKCLQSSKIKHCTFTFQAKHITGLITMNPEVPVKAIQEQKKFHVVVSKTKAFRAKENAHVHLRGDVTVQHSLLRDYVSELHRCNPYTTVKINVYREEDPKKSQECLGEYMSAWMLTAVGVDANNGIYPVAYSIVESENQYPWTWFLTCLVDDLDMFRYQNIATIYSTYTSNAAINTDIPISTDIAINKLRVQNIATIYFTYASKCCNQYI
ncbi:hypothetical protein Tco_0790102 [Tanacetum coccineum]